MTRLGLAGALLAVALVGCQQPKFDMEAMMQAPERPAELDQLQFFIGRWKGTAEMTMPGSDEVCTSTGVNTVSWAADRWVMMEQLEITGEDDWQMSALGLWTWDPKLKKFRTFSADNWGMQGHGTGYYDDAAKTWYFEGKSIDPASGMRTSGTGTAKIINNNTMEWQYTEYTGWPAKKFMEINGTSIRQ